MEIWFKKAYLTLRLLSLDVVLGAFAALLFTSRYLKSDVDLAIGGIFALSVWIIYATDHLLDGVFLKENGVFKRHQFFYKHQKTFFILLILAVLADIYLIIFHLPTNLQITGGILGVFVIIYMLLTHLFSKKREINFFKEFFIALVYSLATWSFPFVFGNFNYTSSIIPGFSTFFLIILQNVLIFSYYEYDLDNIMNKRTFPHFYGKKLTKTLILSFSVIVFLLCLLMVALYSKKVTFILAYFLIEIILTIIILFNDYFSQDERYGIVADASIYLLTISTFLQIL